MPTKLQPRDLSWLQFNARVLQEATDQTVPLYERIKFLAIYSSNLEEFYRVRVSILRQFDQLTKEERRNFLDYKPKQELKAIRREVALQQGEFGRIFREEILPQLEQEGIHLLHGYQFDAAQQDFVKDYFDREIAPHLKVHELSVDGEGKSPFIEDKTLYLTVDIAHDEDDRLLLVNIPSPPTKRFVVLPSQDDRSCVCFVDSIIRANLERFLDLEIDGAYSFKLSRDAQMYMGNEFQGDLLEKIEKSLEERGTGQPTRFLFDANTPDWMRKALKNRLNLSKYDMIPGARYHNFMDFFGFPLPPGKDYLMNPEQPPLDHHQLRMEQPLLPQMEATDQLLSFSYQKYGYVPTIIREAADHPEVTKIQITLYRVASQSQVVTNLLYAREKGKTVEVFVEAKARFDEASNLFWGKKLAEAGAFVRYSYPAVKVHTKLFRVTRELSDGQELFYTYVGTGNFNEKTAKIYGDHALLTTHPEIGEDVGKVFSLLAGRLILPECQHLLVAPFTMKERFVKLIKEQIKRSRKELPAELFLKMNSLEEPEMIALIRKAARTGVKVRLIVRGICRLVPAADENIEIISIIDRYLEHARIFIFGPADDYKVYIGSADWMKRNLHRRVEVVTPIFDPQLASDLRHIMNVQWRDNAKARLIQAEGINAYRQRTETEPVYRAQSDLYDYFKEKQI
ncbi:MAG: polyphosphate kinase 1 [Bacteroidota bacterium]